MKLPITYAWYVREETSRMPQEQENLVAVQYNAHYAMHQNRSRGQKRTLQKVSGWKGRP